ncbi:hypothetical protein ACJX0J_009690 [Zea mays]
MYLYHITHGYTHNMICHGIWLLNITGQYPIPGACLRKKLMIVHFLAHYTNGIDCNSFAMYLVLDKDLGDMGLPGVFQIHQKIWFGWSILTKRIELLWLVPPIFDVFLHFIM